MIPILARMIVAILSLVNVFSHLTVLIVKMEILAPITVSVPMVLASLNQLIVYLLITNV